MKLSELISAIEPRTVHGATDAEITAVVVDSRLVTPGAMFVAIPGLQQDGAKFIDSAIAKGAAVVVAERGVGGNVPFVEVADARQALSLLAAKFYGNPAERLSIVGVTGTSGKTTTTKMIESVFDAMGGPVGLIGTIEYRAGEERLMADRTTPDAVVLQQWFAKMVAAGVHNAVMEVSSHALALKRTYGVMFAAAVFTNLSRDHFDFHKSFDDYFAAKSILFDQIERNRRNAIVNIDDEYGRRLAGTLGERVVTFGREASADIHPAPGFAISVEGLHGTLVTPRGEIRIESNLLGMPNLYNWMGAIGAAIAVGVSTEAIERGVRDLSAVRGRFERVSHEGNATVIIDYAHKPDALEKLLHAVRDLAQGRRVVVLFGCGGDRDKGKRPEMGRIAAELADLTILTSDNPRSESPDAILDDVEAGMSGCDRAKYRRIADRRAAIESAIAEAGDDSVVVIAGKGHETYQVTGEQIVHFDDREEAELALRRRGENATSK
jgi:UDP-N-acetylmuramoyl-L-alanyl-D-glutamate--2,6-diaminopimelate ligase